MSLDDRTNERIPLSLHLPDHVDPELYVQHVDDVACELAEALA